MTPLCSNKKQQKINMKEREKINKDKTKLAEKMGELLNRLDLSKFELTKTSMSYSEPWLISDQAYSFGDVTITVFEGILNHGVRYIIRMGDVVIDHTIAVEHLVGGAPWHSVYFSKGEYCGSTGTIGINLPKHIGKFIEDKARELVAENKIRDDKATLDTLDTLHVCATGESISNLTLEEAFDKAGDLIARTLISLNADPNANSCPNGTDVSYKKSFPTNLSFTRGGLTADVYFYPHFNNSIKAYLYKIQLNADERFRSVDITIKSEECYKIVMDNRENQLKEDKEKERTIYEVAIEHLSEVKV